MKIHSADFLTSAAELEGCPDGGLGEFAFIGRSNVGKSSLLNMLTQRRGLAKVSSTPGATQLINFFLINGNWHMVDLPGYGYSKTPQKIREGFQQMVSEYLLERESLRCVFVLVDSRHSPQKIDLKFCGWLAEAGIPFVVVFTKIDKSKGGKVKANVDAFLRELAEVVDGEPRTFLTSSEKGSGRVEVLEFIDKALRA
ncbi:MAG: ribosome biogenesis GTP-binding protein YihA/YsxC [Verrucomicrobiales bacterium]